MSALEVLSCGPCVTVQDTGRTGYRRFGVSTAGAMDRAALALANALVGNAPGKAALELPYLGAAFRLSAGATGVSAMGADATLSINGRSVPPATSAALHNGDVIEVGSARTGVYTYLALAGGIVVPEELGSRSGHQRTGFGPAPLCTGDALPLTAPDTTDALTFTGSAAPGIGPIRVVPGPQDGHFPQDTWAAFLNTPFRISPRSDRMGLRLDGPPLTSGHGHDIVSEGVVPGSIQVPGDGQPIVLGRDCQTTGGYPKIATVISADLGRLAQVPPGASIRFKAVSLEEAIAAARALDDWVGALGTALRPARSGSMDLHQHNLISGITNPHDH